MVCIETHLIHLIHLIHLGQVSLLKCSVHHSGDAVTCRICYSVV